MVISPGPKVKIVGIAVIIIFIFIALFFALNGSDEGARQAGWFYFALGVLALVFIDVTARLNIIK